MTVESNATRVAAFSLNEDTSNEFRNINIPITYFETGFSPDTGDFILMLLEASNPKVFRVLNGEEYSFPEFNTPSSSVSGDIKSTLTIRIRGSLSGTLLVVRKTVIGQAYADGDTNTLERQLDRLVLKVQGLADDSSKALKFLDASGLFEDGNTYYKPVMQSVLGFDEKSKFRMFSIAEGELGHLTPDIVSAQDTETEFQFDQSPNATESTKAAAAQTHQQDAILFPADVSRGLPEQRAHRLGHKRGDYVGVYYVDDFEDFQETDLFKLEIDTIEVPTGSPANRGMETQRRAKIVFKKSGLFNIHIHKDLFIRSSSLTGAEKGELAFLPQLHRESLGSTLDLGRTLFVQRGIVPTDSFDWLIDKSTGLIRVQAGDFVSFHLEWETTAVPTGRDETVTFQISAPIKTSEIGLTVVHDERILISFWETIAGTVPQHPQSDWAASSGDHAIRNKMYNPAVEGSGVGAGQVRPNTIGSTEVKEDAGITEGQLSQTVQDKLERVNPSAKASTLRVDGHQIKVDDNEGNTTSANLPGAAGEIGALSSRVDALETATEQATEEARGTAELASDAEAKAGTNDTNIMTPLKSKSALDEAIPENKRIPDYAQGDAGQALKVNAAGDGLEFDTVAAGGVETRATLPENPSPNQRVKTTETTTFHQDRSLFAISTPNQEQYIFPDAPANGVHSIVGYSDAYGNEASPFRNKVFLVTQGSFQLPAGAQIVLYEIGGSGGRVVREVSDTALSNVFPHWYEIAGLQYSDIDDTQFTYGINYRASATSPWLYPDREYGPGDWTYSRNGWIQTPGLGLDRQQVLDLIRANTSTNSIDKLMDGAGIGLSVSQAGDAYSNLTGFTTPFDLDIADYAESDDVQPSGVLEVEAIVSLVTKQQVNVGFNPGGGQQRVRLSGFTFASTLRDTTNTVNNIQHAVEIARTPLYRGATEIGELVLYLGADANNVVGYFWHYDEGTGGSTFSVGADLDVAFIHQQGRGGDTTSTASLPTLFASVRKTSTQIVSSGQSRSQRKITWDDAAESDDSNMWDASTDEFVIARAGRYKIYAKAVFNNVAFNTRCELVIRKNSVGIDAHSELAGGSQSDVEVIANQEFAAGDRVSVASIINPARIYTIAASPLRNLFYIKSIPSSNFIGTGSGGIATMPTVPQAADGADGDIVSVNGDGLYKKISGVWTRSKAIAQETLLYSAPGNNGIALTTTERRLTLRRNNTGNAIDWKEFFALIPNVDWQNRAKNRTQPAFILTAGIPAANATIARSGVRNTDGIAIRDTGTLGEVFISQISGSSIDVLYTIYGISYSQGWDA